MKTKFCSWLLVGCLACLHANAADIEGTLRDRAATGAAIVWKPTGPGIEAFRVSVRDVTTGQIIVAPFQTDQTSLQLPIVDQPDSQLNPLGSYEVVIQPLPDGVPAKVLIPPASAMAPPGGGAPFPGGATLDADLDVLLAENEMDITKRYASNDKIRAQADLIWANRGWFKSFARHRIDMAIAADVELDTWTKTVSSYFDRRDENMRGKMRVIDRYEQMKDQRLALRDNAKERLLYNLMNHPELSGNVETGLNFLLSQFVGTPIGYGVGLDDYFQSHPSHSRWDLTPEMLESIRVVTPKDDGGAIEFSLADPEPLKFDWWPPYLRNAAFRPAVERLSIARDQLVFLSAQQPELPIEAIDELGIAFAELSRQYFATIPQKQFLSTQQHLELLAVEDHLGKLRAEIDAVRMRGNISTMANGQNFDPVEDGKNAATLVAWMNRNGMTFAAPRPGTSSHYNELLNDLKELMTIFGPEPLDPDAPQTKTNPGREVGKPVRDKTTGLE